MKHFRTAFSLVCSSLAFSSLASAGPRYHFEASTEEVPRKFSARLKASNWLETVEPPDVTVGMAFQPGATKACWTVSIRWWDSKASASSPLCAPKHVGFTGTSGPTAAELDRLVLEPAQRFAEQSAASRRQVRLVNRGSESVTVKAGNAQAPLAFGPSGALVWLSSDAATVSAGPCTLAIEEPMTEVDVHALTANRTLRLALMADGVAVEQLKTQKDSAFELALRTSPSGTDATLPCSGKLIATLDAKPTEYTATANSTAAKPSVLGAWTVKTKADDGTLIVRVRAENAPESAAASLSLNFSLPWWQTTFTKLLAVLGGIGVLVATITSIVEPVRKLFKKSA